MKNRIILILLATSNLLIATFIFAVGLIYASHTIHNLSLGCLRLLVHLIGSLACLMMLREGGLRRGDGKVLAVLLVLSVLGYVAVRFA